MVTPDLWSVIRQISLWVVMGSTQLKRDWWDFERFRPVGCWHLVVASPIDGRTLRYWLVCWKAHVSLYFQQSTGLWLYVQCKCHPRSTTGRAHHGLYWCFYVPVCLIFAVSLPRLQQILCIHVWILMFTCLNLVLLLLRLFSSYLFVIHIQWLTVRRLLCITSFDFSHLLCETCSFIQITSFLTSLISSFFPDFNFFFFPCKINKIRDLSTYFISNLRCMLAYKSTKPEIWMLPFTQCLAPAQLKIF